MIKRRGGDWRGGGRYNCIVAADGARSRLERIGGAEKSYCGGLVTSRYIVGTAGEWNG